MGGREGGGSRAVMVDAQFGIVRTLRPFNGFEEIYQGQNAGRMIMFTEEGKAIDELASLNTAGFDPLLLRGIDVPLGCRVILWIPWVTAFHGVEGQDPVPYRWYVAWRLRNTADRRLARSPYHHPKQGQGPPDTSGATPQPRVVLPCAGHVLDYAQGEPAAVGNRAIIDAYPEAVEMNGAVINPRPLLPNGTAGTFQQGIIDPGALANVSSQLATSPMFNIHEIQAFGDEMLLGVYRVAEEGSITWDFDDGPPQGADFWFSSLYGIGLGQAWPDIGVYMICGSAP